MTPSKQKPVALVTGGARGIGLGIAQALARESFDLVICGVRDPSAAADSLAGLRSLGADAHYVQADIGDAAARRYLVEAARQHFGRLHVLVNNAGVAPKVRADLLEATRGKF